MSFGRSFLPAAAVAAALLSIACGEPPEKEMQQAQGAIDTARAAGADLYAREEFAAAQEALKRSQDAVAERDYRLALNHALDSRERAQTAAKEAADRRAAARVDADHAISALAASLDAARAALKAATGARIPSNVMTDARTATANAARRLQEARTAFERGDYQEIGTALPPVTSQLDASVRAVNAARSATVRRRR